jgi:hypothetical protein
LQIYLLETQYGQLRLYAEKLGTLTWKLYEYSVYIDYQGAEWLHVRERKSDICQLFPFYRLDTAEEYLEYLKRI